MRVIRIGCLCVRMICRSEWQYMGASVSECREMGESVKVSAGVLVCV